jgi:hypothetical protein
MSARDDDGQLLAIVRERLSLDGEVLRWRTRPPESFATKRAFGTWNSRYAYGAVGPKFCLTVNGNKFSLLAHRARFALSKGRWPRYGEASDKGR